MKLVEGSGDRTPLWTPGDAAAFLRVTLPALYMLVYRREIPHLKVGRRLRFDPERVRAWLREKEVGT